VSSFNRQNTPPYRGQFNFDGRYSGNAFADYLLGASSFTSRNTRNALNENVNSRYFAYVQDDWNVNAHLTVNVGVRYEYEAPFHNGVTPGDLANFDPGTNKVVVIAGIADADPRLLGLPIVDGGKVGIDLSNYTYPDRNNFAPRLGFAWRPLAGSRLVVRSSYGVFYNVIAGYNGMLGMGITNPPFRAQETFEPTAASTPNLTWTTPFPGVGTLPTNPALLAVARNRVNPYMQQWNFTTEYEVARNTAVRASYIGNKGTHLERNANINEPPMASGAVQPRRPYQPWGPITYWESGRNSILNQVQVGFVRRYSSGFTFQSEYQFSRALNEFTFGDAPANNQNFRYDRGNQDNIRRHYSVSNYSYELPFGRGRHFLSGVSGAMDKVVGGWQIAGIVTLGSGAPYSVSSRRRCWAGWRAAPTWPPAMQPPIPATAPSTAGLRRRPSRRRSRLRSAIARATRCSVRGWWRGIRGSSRTPRSRSVSVRHSAWSFSICRIERTSACLGATSACPPRWAASPAPRQRRALFSSGCGWIIDSATARTRLSRSVHRHTCSGAKVAGFWVLATFGCSRQNKRLIVRQGVAVAA